VFHAPPRRADEVCQQACVWHAHGIRHARASRKEVDMNSPRPTRNIQQVRSIIQNMGRSIDEARNRRLGPNEPFVSVGAAASNGSPSAAESRAASTVARAAAVAVPAASSTTSTMQAPAASPAPATLAQAPRSAEPGVAPPVRSAQEMFSGDAPRLKARPKRPA
jgi:hypothetical protein